MSIKVVILESAEHDLKELRSYIVRNFSLKTWQNTYDKIKEVIRNLKTRYLIASYLLVVGATPTSRLAMP